MYDQCLIVSIILEAIKPLNTNIMFILKNKDVEIFNIKHPTRDQLIPLLIIKGKLFVCYKYFL